MTQLKVKSPEAVAKLRQAAWKKFGDDHPVRRRLTLLSYYFKMILLGQGSVESPAGTSSDIWRQVRPVSRF